MQQQFIFYFSAMKGGKTTRIFQRIHDFEENGQRVCLIKPKIDTKGGNCIINRLGERKEVTIFLSKTESLLTKKKEKLLTNYQQIIVDEAQFLTPKQVEQLWIINKSKKIIAPTDDYDKIYIEALKLLDKLSLSLIRLVGVSVSDLIKKDDY